MADSPLDLQTGDQPIPRIPSGESGYVGLKQINGVILEESRRELQYPLITRTFKQMSMDAVIASGLNLFEMMISRVKWDVKIPKDASEETKKQAKFLKQCQEDMEHSWYAFIKEAVSFYKYGFSVHEIVLRKRLNANGSRYNDGLVGIRKLPIRSQDTIAKWDFSEDGRDLLGVYQSPNIVMGDRYGYYSTNMVATGDSSLAYIRRQKFLLFTADSTRSNPQGKSPLLNCYYAWKYRTKIEEQEAIGVSRDLGGIPSFEIPSDYMAAEDGPKKDAADAYMKIGRNIQANEQACVVTPSDRDDRGNKLFDFKLVSSQGAKQYDSGAIIARYNNAILQALWADVLQMGQSNVGSYSLSDTKTNLVAMAVQDKLIGMREVLKELRDLLFRMNGWSLDTELPYWDFEDLESQDLDVYSKFVQRIGAVGFLPKTPEVLNDVLNKMGLNAMPEDSTIEDFNVGDNESGAGEGMTSGLGGGTGTNSGSSGDASSANTENKSLFKNLNSEEFVEVEFNGKKVKMLKEDWESLDA